MKFYFAELGDDDILRLKTYDHNGNFEIILESDKCISDYWGLADHLNARKLSYPIPPYEEGTEDELINTNPKSFKRFIDYMEMCFDEFESLFKYHASDYYEEKIEEINSVLFHNVNDKSLFEVRDVCYAELKKILKLSM